MLPVSKCVQRPHFSLEASRTQKKEKGGYRAGHSKKKKKTLRSLTSLLIAGKRSQC